MTKAVRFERFGGVEVLEVTDVTVPDPEPGEVLVELRAAGINPGEAAIRRGDFERLFQTTFPSGEGSDLAGVVLAVGPGVERFSAGDEVLGWSDRRSSHAERVIVPEDHLIDKPAGVSWEVAGSLAVAGLSAWSCVRAIDTKAGETIVVSAAAGGVGSIVVQLLITRDANVIGIASETNHDWLRSLGVTPVAYGDELAHRILAVAPTGVQGFIDLFGGGYVEMAVRELRIAAAKINTIIDFAASKDFNTHRLGMSASLDIDVLAKLTELVTDGRIEIPIAATYPFERVRDAYTQLEARHTRGKIVLVP